MIRIILVDSDKLLCKEYALEIARDEEFALVAVTGRQSDAINILTEQEVDAVIVNLELEEGDGIHLIIEMKRKLKKHPEIIVTTNYGSEHFLHSINKLDIDLVYKKNNELFSPKKIIEIIKLTAPTTADGESEYHNGRKVIYTEQEETEIQYVLAWGELIKSGFEPDRKGTKYLARAIGILLAVPNGTSIQITNDVYPQVAQVYQTSVSGVEKSIRNVIERVWSRPDKGISYLKNPEWRGSIQNKPSNTEYIQCVVRRLRNVLH